MWHTAHSDAICTHARTPHSTHTLRLPGTAEPCPPAPCPKRGMQFHLLTVCSIEFNSNRTASEPPHWLGTTVRDTLCAQSKPNKATQCLPATLGMQTPQEGCWGFRSLLKVSAFHTQICIGLLAWPYIQTENNSMLG